TARDLDGLQFLRAGAAYNFSAQRSVGLHFQSMMRRRTEEFDYLLFPKEWSSIEDRPNASLNLSFNNAYTYPKGYGSLSMLARAPFFTGNRDDAFNYSFVQLELINTRQLGKLELRTRLFGRYGTGSRLPYESLL